MLLVARILDEFIILCHFIANDWAEIHFINPGSVFMCNILVRSVRIIVDGFIMLVSSCQRFPWFKFTDDVDKCKFTSECRWSDHPAAGIMITMIFKGQFNPAFIAVTIAEGCS